MNFKPFITKKECSEIKLILWFVPVKFIRSVLKFDIFNIFFQAIPMLIPTSLEKLSLYYRQISLW